MSNHAKAVVVHAGARDSYQVALALSQAGILEALITDLFWPISTHWAKYLDLLMPARLRELAMRRSSPLLSSQQVRSHILLGLYCLLLEKLPSVFFQLRRNGIRALDAALGRAAGRLARQSGAGLITYSYCGYDAIRHYGAPALLFQAHPHPSTMRNILVEELALHPDCASSLEQEWELALPEQDFQHLVAETRMASHYLVASSFTKRSLVENGIAPESVTVIPYGVDLDRFHPAKTSRPFAETWALRLLFVGRINQRKGVKYLLEALRLLGPANLHLTVCGRVVDDLSLFKPFADQVTIRPSVSASELVEAYQDADLFVFPSIAEGFGQVLLEALACGLPILTTTHTAAPDIIRDGEQGFIVEPRRPDLLAERIAWVMDHPRELEDMKVRARAQAETFTWERFRLNVASQALEYLMHNPVAQPRSQRVD